MRHSVLGLLIVAIAGSTSSAQQRSGCIGPQGVPIDSLLAQARRLHPDALKPENESGDVVVALVYDNTCTLVRHAMKRVSWMQGGIEAILTQVFPDSTRLTLRSFEVSGFATLTAARAEGRSPVIAWGLLTPRGIPRMH
jgi:hypothetical protein